MPRMDLEYLSDAFKPYAYYFAGALFGIAWWCFADAVTYSVAFDGMGFNFVWLLPGLGATVAVICMNLVSRDETNSDMNFDEGEVCRTRLVLLLSYLFSLASIGGAVAILLQMKHDPAVQDVWVGAGCVIQTSCICASGMVAWWWQKDSEGYSYIY